MFFENRRSLLAVRNHVPLCLISLITAPFPLIPAAHAQEQLWITQFGTSDWEQASALASDGAGGVIVAGWTGGSMGGPNLGGYDAFLTRYDGAGNRLWLRQLAGIGFDWANALAPDGAGGVFVAGTSHSGLGAPAPVEGPFLARYDSNGNRLWIQQFGVLWSDWATALTPDGAGGVFVAGGTGGSLGGPSAGGGDAFLAHYDSAGNQLWISQFGTSEDDLAKALAPDGAGGVMVAGRTGGSLGGPFAGGVRDAFLTRYDGAGNQLWIRQFGTSEVDDAIALAPDGAGGVMVAGYLLGRMSMLSWAVEQDAFLARYDATGNQLWIRQFGTAVWDKASALTPDGVGGVIVAGSTQGSLGGPNAGSDDIFLARYDGAGDRVWIRQFGISSTDLAYAIAPDGAGGVMVAGSTQGSWGGPNAGGDDVFLARYDDSYCYADCDGNGSLDIFDFLCFQNSFVSGEPYACDCDPNPVCDIFDFLCFQNAFVAGCP